MPVGTIWGLKGLLISRPSTVHTAIHNSHSSHPSPPQSFRPLDEAPDEDLDYWTTAQYGGSSIGVQESESRDTEPRPLAECACAFLSLL